MYMRAIKMFVFLLFFSAMTGCGYNSIQQNDESVNRAWGDLESQLQRRSDLVPNLVATVKGVANFERDADSGC